MTIFTAFLATIVDARIVDHVSTRSAGSPFPITSVWWVQALIVMLAYVLAIAMSGKIVRFFVSPPTTSRESESGQPQRFDSGVIIGKCENILAVTLVLIGEYAGLGLVFAGKTFARSEDMQRNPSYYLGGTLVNLVWGMGIAVLAKLLAFGL
jgi:hypothetical protein